MTASVETDTLPKACSAASTRTLHALRSASALLERAIARALDPYGLTASQFAVLHVMAEAQDQALPCSELGKRLTGPASDITRLLDRLETGGLVSRKRNKTDRPVVHTMISEKGREVLQTATPAVRAAEEHALSHLDEQERAQLSELLAGVLRGFPVD